MAEQDAPLQETTAGTPAATALQAAGPAAGRGAGPGAGAQQAADRLEAALERIARAATTEIIRAGRDRPADPGAVPPAEIAARLDELIARLRAVLAETA